MKQLFQMSLPSNFRIGQKQTGDGDNTVSYNTASLIILCQPNQAKHIQPTLQKIQNNRLRPDEIILVINNAQRVNQQLQPNNYVKIIKSQSNLVDHDLFNIGIDSCTSDIIIFHKLGEEFSDQKIDIIKYFFSRFKVAALSHLCGNIIYDDYSQIKYSLQRDGDFNIGESITQNPLPAVTRTVALKSKITSDRNYFEVLSETYTNSIIIDAELGS